jgi:hypothetical protein
VAGDGGDDGTSVDTSTTAADTPSQNTAQTTQSRQSTGYDGTAGTKETAQTKSAGATSDDLTPEEVREVEKLQKRDKEVKAHEMAHLMAAGAFARGGAHYDYEVGPDGKRYAVGGEVSIDISKIANDPKATIQKMRTVERAALAPASPSAQDRRVAADAEQAQIEAQLQLIQLNIQQADTAYRKQSGSSGSETASSDQGLVHVVG